MKTIYTIILLFLLSTVHCITHTVNLDGSAQYTSIQSAINASVNGDTVLVYPGRYLENLTISTSGLTLESLEAITNDSTYIETTIIDGNATNSCIKVYAGVQNLVIRGFSITNALVMGNGGGIGFFPNVNGFIINCHIFNNVAQGGAGIALGDAWATLSGVRIYNNKCNSVGGGILVMNSGSNLIFDPINLCSVYNNTACHGQDIYIRDARRNIDAYLDTYTIDRPSDYFVQYYNMPGYEYHINMQYQRTVFTETNHDLYVSPEGNDDNDGLTPQTALKSISSAIYRIAEDSLNCKTVHIGPGTYSYSLNQQSLPIGTKSWVNIVGAGTDNTIIRAEVSPLIDENGTSIFSVGYAAHSCISGMNLAFQNNLPGFVIVGRDVEDLTIKNITVENFGFTSGRIIYSEYMRNCTIDGLVVDNIILDFGDIIECQSGFSGVIKNCRFTNCTSLDFSASVWVNPLIWIHPKGETVIENCLFDNLTMSDNDTHCIELGNGSISESINISIINCQFTDITGNPEAVFSAATGNSNTNIINTTIAGCTASSYGLVTYGNVHITNSIFYNNSIPHQVYIYPLSNGEHTNLTLDYNCFRNGQAGIFNPGTGNQVHYLNTNVTYDPLFLGGEDNDPLRYSLSNMSRCIDRGTPDTLGLSLPIADLAGNYRVWNNRIDMGCYEYGAEPVGNEDDVQNPEVFFTLSNYPNPFNPSTVISCSLKDAATVRLNIYNIRGQHVKTLVNERMTAGTHTVLWNGCDDSGQACASGVYFSRLTAGDKVVTRKMVLLK